MLEGPLPSQTGAQQRRKDAPAIAHVQANCTGADAQSLQQKLSEWPLSQGEAQALAAPGGGELLPSPAVAPYAMAPPQLTRSADGRHPLQMRTSGARSWDRDGRPRTG